MSTLYNVHPYALSGYPWTRVIREHWMELKTTGFLPKSNGKYYGVLTNYNRSQ